jgi:hypothetical protein
MATEERQRNPLPERRHEPLEQVEDTGRVRPGRAGVLGLGDEHGHPRRVEERRGAKRDRAVAQGCLVPRQKPEERHQQAEEEVERPVVRVEQQREDDREHGHVSPPAQHERVRERRDGHEAEQRDQAVHARLGGVNRDELVERCERRTHPARPPPEERCAHPERHRDRREREEQRQRVRRYLAAAGDLHPEVQQQVVERRRAVLAEQPRDGSDGVRGDADRETLVDPVALAEPARAPGQRGRDEQREENSGVADARYGHP